MCSDLLRVVYRSVVERDNSRVPFIERKFDTPLELTVLSEDEHRNLPTLYKTLFSDDCASYVEKLYADAMRELRGLSYEESEHIIDGLDFIQLVIATAMYKYGCTVGQTLRCFAREFDRFDVTSERQRLHNQAQLT